LSRLALGSCNAKKTVISPMTPTIKMGYLNNFGRKLPPDSASFSIYRSSLVIIAMGVKKSNLPLLA
jgi:hypothetical protein